MSYKSLAARDPEFLFQLSSRAKYVTNVYVRVREI